LTAAWVFFTVFGIIDDWALRYWCGDSPEEAWDDYLSSFVQALPYSSNRAGTFKPLPSFWDRFFHRHSKPSNPIFPGSFDGDPTSSELDVKLIPLLADDLSSHHSPIPESAIPEPFYAQTPPPPSLLRSKSKPAFGAFHPKPNVGPDGDKSTDDSEDYVLPPFVKKRRKKSRVRLRLYNPDSTTTKSPPVAKSVGFRALPIPGKDTDVENRKPAFGQFGEGSISSATLVGSEGRPDNHSSGSGRSDRGKTSGKSGIKEVPRPDDAPKLEYSDHEVDLTSLAQDKQQEGKERNGGIPKFMERRMSQPSPASPIMQPTAVNFTPASAPRTTTSPVLKTTGTDPSVSDRARERVRAFVASSPVRHHSGHASLSQLPLAQKPSAPAEETQKVKEVGRTTEARRSPIAEPLSPLPLPASVPATPSLINALHRVALAQQQAFGGITDELHAPTGAQDEKKNAQRANYRSPTIPNVMGRHERGDSVGVWDDFWHDVRAKAHSPER